MIFSTVMNSTRSEVCDLFPGFSALQLAVRGGHLESVQQLVRVGNADVNLRDGCCGRTALHHAVNSDNLAIVGHLLLEVRVNYVFAFP